MVVALATLAALPVSTALAQPSAPPVGLQAPLQGPQAPTSHVHHPQSA